MSGLPCGRPGLNRGQLIGRDMGPHHLPMLGILLLPRPFHRCCQIQPVVGLQRSSAPRPGPSSRAFPSSPARSRRPDPPPSGTRPPPAPYPAESLYLHRDRAPPDEAPRRYRPCPPPSGTTSPPICNPVPRPCRPRSSLQRPPARPRPRQFALASRCRVDPACCALAYLRP